MSLKLSVRNLILPDPGDYILQDFREARVQWAKFKTQYGFKQVSTVFGTLPEYNLKYGKDKQVLIAGLSLAPARISGINVCYGSTKECRKYCVAHSGNGHYSTVIRSRIAKTQFLFQYPLLAGILLDNFIENMAKRGQRLGLDVGIRLNTFSDIPFEIVAPWVFIKYNGRKKPKINFFDYTKLYYRNPRIRNYRLTYSASELTTDNQIQSWIDAGQNVAVVFDTKRIEDLPKKWHNIRVIDGDKSDARWKDPQGVIVGLRAKGRLIGQKSDFVRRG